MSVNFVTYSKTETSNKDANSEKTINYGIGFYATDDIINTLHLGQKVQVIGNFFIKAVSPNGSIMNNSRENVRIENIKITIDADGKGNGINNALDKLYKKYAIK